MSRSRSVARGSAVLLTGQLVSVAVQVAYGAATARLLAPAAFGAFAIAISLTGLFAILLTAGLMTYVLAQKHLESSAAWTVWLYASVAGAAGAIVTLAIAPIWADLWHSPGSVDMTRWLSLQVLFNSLAVAQAAFLRREHRALADALTQSSGVVVGLIVGIAATWTIRQPVCLVVSPILASVVTATAAYGCRSERYAFQRPRQWRNLLSLHSQISQQNLYFFALGSLPIWVLGISVDSHRLGLFSRAVVIPGLLFTALSTGLIRSLQPYYRHFTTREDQGKGLADAAILSAAIGFPLFFGLGTVASPLVNIWLGKGWQPSAQYVAPAAAGYAIYTVFTVVANASETLGFLREVRLAQYAMAPGALLLSAITLLAHSPFAAALITLAVAVCGLVRLAFALAGQDVLRPAQLLRPLAFQTLFAGAIAVGVWLIVRRLTAGGFSPVSVILVAVASFGGAYLATVWIRPEWEAARRRNLLSGWVERRIVDR